MKLLGLVLLAAAIYAIVMIVQSSAETMAKVLWVVLILIVPLIGLIIWAIMGPGSPLKR
ncbi:MAG: PLDc N-terminal domain-containing protein [Pseudomonadota bacterium]|uniref:PLDc N-terminal domain-containing protein n=1 Tax=Alcanivorax sp. TaxID=1872427 RepID=UPI0025C6AFF3|nr:PLDc N-terminal domain-containing protein [Alcanivorax sp.]MED5240070.1 PLDc N-terminal domain-containing protein [Pseudomonadota bacterium]MEE3319233.1 PLDc N-terminal domain-containing protein [Pseudomonadota bacterium]